MLGASLEGKSTQTQPRPIAAGTTEVDLYRRAGRAMLKDVAGLRMGCVLGVSVHFKVVVARCFDEDCPLSKTLMYAALHGASPCQGAVVAIVLVLPVVGGPTEPDAGFGVNNAALGRKDPACAFRLGLLGKLLTARRNRRRFFFAWILFWLLWQFLNGLGFFWRRRWRIGLACALGLDGRPARIEPASFAASARFAQFDMQVVVVRMSAAVVALFVARLAMATPARAIPDNELHAESVRIGHEEIANGVALDVVGLCAKTNRQHNVEGAARGVNRCLVGTADDVPAGEAADAENLWVLV